MDVVHDDELEHYMEEAVRVSPDKPILVDEFLEGAVELDVDAVSDREDVLGGGVMEYVESVGVHSGDSAYVIPPRSLSDDTLERVHEVVKDIATTLDTVGLLNVQLAVQGGGVYVLEVTPRSSRTVPFVSKATGVPIAKVAAKVMASHLLEDLEVSESVPEQYSIKEVVLPFDRLPGSDPRLGPEMKSTGEVMGSAGEPGLAYRKAQRAADNDLKLGGTAVVDREVDGFEEYFDVETFDDVQSAIRRGDVDFVVSRDVDALRTAVEEEVPHLSTAESAEAMLEALAHHHDDLDVAPVSDRPIRDEQWG